MHHDTLLGLPSCSAGPAQPPDLRLRVYLRSRLTLHGVDARSASLSAPSRRLEPRRQCVSPRLSVCPLDPYQDQADALQLVAARSLALVPAPPIRPTRRRAPDPAQWRAVPGASQMRQRVHRDSPGQVVRPVQLVRALVARPALLRGRIEPSRAAHCCSPARGRSAGSIAGHTPASRLARSPLAQHGGACR